MKLAISLDDYIYSQIFYWPSLYYREDFEKSKLRVLNYLFLVNGTGIKYSPEFRNFNSNKYAAISNNRKNRIKQGEKLIEVCKGGKILDYFSHKKVSRNLDKRYKIYFERDFYKLNIKFFKNYEIVSKDITESEVENANVITIYPDDNIEYEKMLDKLNQNCFYRPYPFSLHYVPMWDEENKKLIDKDLIADDWREGIIWVYEKSLAWLTSESFYKDTYFNWALTVGKPGCTFTQRWNNNSLEKMCKDYEIPFKEYKSPKEMSIDLVEKNKKEKIDTAQLIIDTYK